MDGLKNILNSDMEGLKDGIAEKMKSNMEDLKNGLKADMEGLKEGLTKFLQEIIPNGEKVLYETHEENKLNINHDFMDSNIRLKINHIPNINMRNFDDKDMMTWILQMEQYFDRSKM